MKHLMLSVLFAAVSFGASAQITWNEYNLFRDGKPWIPVMGEVHYCRIPQEDWRNELKKCKAGGLDVVATYVFWNVHEEKEGEFRWDGRRNLREFVKLCKEEGLDAIVRLGPFCHGEIRNGGLPDWLLAKPLQIRSDDPLYLKYVTKLYGEIAQQLEGLYCKDGGPVIGVQLENEYRHAAAPNAIFYEGSPTEWLSAPKKGPNHLLTLKKIAKSCGIDVPMWTATSWGRATTLEKEGLPVTSCYPYPTWMDNPPPTRFCLLTDLQRDPDYAPLSFDGTKYPVLSAEMGVGIQISYARRFRPLPKAAVAVAIRSLGSGANGIGYYMYHGGVNPKSAYGPWYLGEEPECPKVSYDFQAPLGEWGEENETYRLLRPLHQMVREFGDMLAPLKVRLPEPHCIDPKDRETPRYSMRGDNAGFLFWTNFQDHDTNRHDQTNAVWGVTLPKDASGVFPFGWQMGDAILERATAQPWAKIGDTFVFMAIDGIEPVFSWKDGKAYDKILVLSQADAQNAVRINDEIVVTTASILPDADGGGFALRQALNTKFSWKVWSEKDGWREFNGEVEPLEGSLEWTNVGDRKYLMRVAAPRTEGVVSWFARIDYEGDVGLCYKDGELFHDNFFMGGVWSLPVESGDYVVQFRKTRKQKAIAVNSVRLEPVYELKAGEQR